MRKVKNRNNNLDKSKAEIKSTQRKDKKCREEEDKYLMVVSYNGLRCGVSERLEGYHIRFWNIATRAISSNSPMLCFSIC